MQSPSMMYERSVAVGLLALAAWALAACQGPSRATSSQDVPPDPPESQAQASEAQAKRAKGGPPSGEQTAGPSSKQLEHGAELYGRICAVCHGDLGEGYKADHAPAVGRSEYLVSVSDSFLRTAIMSGRTDSTMSAWSKTRGGPLGPADVDAMIAFMRTWQSGPAVSLDEGPLRGKADMGAKHFEAECKRCHGADGMAPEAVRIGNPELLKTSTNGMLRHAIRKGRPGTQMEAFGDKLGKQGIEDVVAFLRRLQAETKLPPPPPPPPPSQPAPLPLGKVPLHAGGPEPKGFIAHPKTTSADVIQAQLARGAKMVLLDARAPPDYMREHIAGAVSVPYYDPSPYFDELPKDSWLVSYCACPHAESRNLAAKLLKAGFTKVTVLDEGLPYWKGKGYKTQKGVTQGKP